MSIDLHLHTTASDGTCTPAEVVELAKAAGLTAIAITDHDTMNGVAEAVNAGGKLGLEVLPGIELSTDYRGRNTHVLGYGLSPDAPALAAVMSWMQGERRRRNERIAANMRRDGIPVTLKELEAQHSGATIGRPHFAQVLVEWGLAADVADAFHHQLGKGGKYYEKRNCLPMAEAVRAIRESGGAAVLAHPLQYHYSEEELRALAACAAEVGMQGMEVYYTGYGEIERTQLTALAEKFGLIRTGGSDFHGTNKPDIAVGVGHGRLSVPAELLDGLKRCIGEGRA